MQFGLMFFAASEDALSTDKYRLLIECARFGDQHGFSSVWVPERHFTRLGSLYPNPAVLHAALARETTRISLRAGSVVLPLHNPLRVAEEWAIVDNLSNGRVGISCASGWNPDDFAFFPERYPRRHQAMLDALLDVQKLWAGGRLQVLNGSGAPVKVRIYPTPVQPRLPIWMTAAGSPQTFVAAGRLGLNLLTHLLDQSVEVLEENIRLYRQARAEHGHDPATGQVTVMVHTFVGEDAGAVREAARGPYCQYLKTNIGLLKGLAQSRGQEFDLAQMDEADIDNFLNLIYERFASNRGLIGTPETCMGLVDQLGRSGVDEIACLLDFGPDAETILQHLPQLKQLKDRVEAASPAKPAVAIGIPARQLPQEDIAAIRARCQEAMAPQDFYALLRRRGVVMEGAFQGIRQLWRRDEEALALVALPPELADSDEPYQLHPAFLDACLQVVVAALPLSTLSADDTLYMPVGLRSLKSYGRPGARAWSHARLRSSTSSASIEGDIRIFDETGALQLAISGFRLQRVQAPAEPAAQLPGASWLYDIRWHARPLLPRADAEQAPGSWLIFMDRHGVGTQLAQLLERQGATCLRVRRGERYAALQDGSIEVSLGASDDLQRLLDEAQNPYRGVIHLWSLDAPAAQATTVDALAAHQEHALVSALELMQALSARTPSATRTWFVTQGAQPVGNDGAQLSLAQAPLWGLGRCLPLETPRCWSALVDLPGDASPEHAAQQLFSAIWEPDEEDQIALRNGGRYVPRLEQQPAQDLLRQRLSLRPDATYLVTGGLGKLGLTLATWLVENGARHLALLGRSAPSSETRARLAELAAQGAQVAVLQGDIADRAAIERVFDELGASCPPLRGVFHAAGVTSYRPLGELDRETLLEVLRPKVSGTWLLHERTRALELDYFVCISSLSPVWGTKGLGHYAAANHFLDLFAYHGRGLGLATTTVNLGPLAGGGMASASERAEMSMTQVGLRLLDQQLAARLTASIAAAGVAQQIVVDVDWSIFKGVHELHGRRPLLEQIAGAAAAGASGPTALFEQLAAEPGAEGEALLVEHILEIVAGILKLDRAHWPNPRQGFFDMGMDSLMALELKSRLQQSLGYQLATTLAFEYPTAEGLARHILASLFGAALASAPATPAQAASDTLLSEIKELGDDELRALIDAELEVLKQ